MGTMEHKDGKRQVSVYNVLKVLINVHYRPFNYKTLRQRKKNTFWFLTDEL